jgi:hypothetical protein
MDSIIRIPLTMPRDWSLSIPLNGFLILEALSCMARPGGTFNSIEWIHGRVGVALA